MSLSPPVWGENYGLTPLDKDEEGVARGEPAARQIDADLPEAVSWHSGIHFENLDKDWRVIYSRRDKPVMIERRLGKGTVVLATDSYLLSNEAMRSERHPRLLAWLVGPSRKVLFDETHLGVEENPGMMTLARHYNLESVLAVLLLLALLYVWRNSRSLVPPWQEEVARGGSKGKDSQAGFINLVRRSVPRREVLEACFGEWRKTADLDHKSRQEKEKRMRLVLAREKTQLPKDQNPAGAYREMSSIWKDEG